MVPRETVDRLAQLYGQVASAEMKVLLSSPQADREVETKERFLRAVLGKLERQLSQRSPESNGHQTFPRP